jgi:hypothetical protein
MEREREGMASVFAWLDSSEGERRRALDVIDLFDQPETVDLKRYAGIIRTAGIKLE